MHHIFLRTSKATFVDTHTLTVARNECLWVPLPLVLQTAASSSAAPPPRLATPREEAGEDIADADDAEAVAMTSVMEMGIREQKDRISRLAAALLVFGIVAYVIVVEDTHSPWSRTARQPASAGTKKRDTVLYPSSFGGGFQLCFAVAAPLRPQATNRQRAWARLHRSDLPGAGYRHH